MSRVHEKVPQAAEICYVDASASFESLNTSITLIYTSCAMRALPLGLFVTSDESKVTLEKAVFKFYFNFISIFYSILFHFISLLLIN